MRKTMKYFEDSLANLKKEFEEYKKAKMKAPSVGETVEIAGMEWIILDKNDVGYLAITKEFERTSVKFDDSTNNWANSDLRNYLNTNFLEKVEKEIGEGVLPEFDRDLTSLDGQTEYGSCKDKVSLLTVDEYRKYRKYLPNTDKWWWLCTPWSTPCNGYKSSIVVVSPSGGFNYYNCDRNHVVRPFCIFPSSIFESEGK